MSDWLVLLTSWVTGQTVWGCQLLGDGALPTDALGLASYLEKSKGSNSPPHILYRRDILQRNMTEQCLGTLEKAARTVTDDPANALILVDQSMELFLKDMCLRIGATEKTLLNALSGKPRIFTNWGFTECVEYLDQNGAMSKEQRAEFLRFHSFRNPVQHVGLQPSEKQVLLIITAYREFVNTQTEAERHLGLATPVLSRFLLTIREMDPDGEIVAIDVANKRVVYSNKIVQHRKVTTLTDEEIVRAYLVVKLKTQLAYRLESLELEKSHRIGRKEKQTEARIDILVRKDQNSFMVFEVKKWDDYDQQLESSVETQLFAVGQLEDPIGKSLRYLIYYSAEATEAGIVEKFETIDFKKFRTFDEWDKDGRPNPRIIPNDYAIVRKANYVKGGKDDLRINVTRKELESVRHNLHNILYAGGKYGGGELFFNLLSIILAKIYDEKDTAVGKPYTFQVIYKNGSIESADEIYTKVDKLYRFALQRFLGYSPDKAKKVPSILFDAPKVKYVVDLLQPISLTQNEHDILGDFFEKIVWSEFKQSKGQYFTHPNIVRFIIRVMGLDQLAVHLLNEENRLPYIIDPACGSGTFLIETMKLITNHVLNSGDQIKRSDGTKAFLGQSFPLERPNAWANEYLYGIENNRDLAVASKVNMVMHGDGTANIEEKDALISFGMFSLNRLKQTKTVDIYPFPVLQSFDAVISNPPFSITIDRETADSLPSNFIWGQRILERFKKQSKKKEVNVETVFLERWYQLLKPKGRLGVILPDSVLDTAENRYVRLFLYKYFKIKAIVSLPPEAFEPYTSTKTSLVIAQKKIYNEVAQYQTEWSKLEKEYDKLERSVRAIAQKSHPLEELTETDTIRIFRRFLHERFDERDSTLSLPQLVEKYKREMKLVDKEWWVFAEISQMTDYPICMANVEEIGYKKTFRNEFVRPNQLMSEESSESRAQKAEINVLDFAAEHVKWE